MTDLGCRVIEAATARRHSVTFSWLAPARRPRTRRSLFGLRGLTLLGVGVRRRIGGLRIGRRILGRLRQRLWMIRIVVEIRNHVGALVVARQTRERHSGAGDEGLRIGEELVQ